MFETHLLKKKSAFLNLKQSSSQSLCVYIYIFE